MLSKLYVKGSVWLRGNTHEVCSVLINRVIKFIHEVVTANKVKLSYHVNLFSS